MPDLDDYQYRQLTGQAECYIHTHPIRHNYVYPHGAFSSSQNQTATINTATTMTFNTVDINDGVDLVGGTSLTVPMDGVYNFQFSAQFSNTDSNAHDVSVWFEKNEVIIPNSNTMLTVPSKHGTIDGHVVAAWNLFVRMMRGDDVEIYWSTPSATVKLEYTAAQTSPVRPATPSIIATVSFVSS